MTPSNALTATVMTSGGMNGKRVIAARFFTLGLINDWSKP
jgi:hypothetical protein